MAPLAMLGGYMSVVVKIQGRDALPVWTLPFVGGGDLPTDKLAGILAGRWPWYKALSAFKLDPEGSPAVLAPKQWDRVVTRIEVRGEALKAKFEVSGDPYPAWEIESAKCFPRNAYVWLDEFARWFSHHQSLNAPMADQGRPKFRPGDREPDLEPMIPEEVEAYFGRGGMDGAADGPKPNPAGCDRHRLSGQKAEELAQQPTLEHTDVLDLLELDDPPQFWSPVDCDFDEQGVRPKAEAKQGIAHLVGQERRVLLEFLKDIRLELPCAPEAFLAWCVRNSFAEVLPPEFVAAVRAREARGLAPMPEDYRLALKLDAWTAREALCWLCGRNPAWFRGDIGQEFPEQADWVARAIRAGRLTADGSSPQAWIAWAMEKEWRVPDELLADKLPEGQDGAIGKARRETEINRWLRETWETEGKPAGAAFFLALKKYQGKKGSPIKEWYPAGEDAGIKWRTSNGASGEWKRKTIQTIASEFRRADRKGRQAL